MGLSTKEVNDLLIKYDKLIKDNVNIALNYNLGVDRKDKFLASRCINVDDVLQEVRIKIWQLLENEYNPKYDIVTFIGFQAVKHTTWFVKNIARSSSYFTGTSTGKHSMQAQIDNNKVSLQEIAEMFDIDEPYIDVDQLKDKSYLRYGDNIDYMFLVDEIVKRLKENDVNSSSANMFLLFVKEPHLFSDLYGSNNKLQVIKRIFNYKTIEGPRHILNKIKAVVKDVIEENRYK